MVTKINELADIAELEERLNIVGVSMHARNEHIDVETAEDLAPHALAMLKKVEELGVLRESLPFQNS